MRSFKCKILSTSGATSRWHGKMKMEQKKRTRAESMAHTATAAASIKFLLCICICCIFERLRSKEEAKNILCKS